MSDARAGFWHEIDYRLDESTEVAKAPGGWLVRLTVVAQDTIHTAGGEPSVSMVFVPDALHEWPEARAAVALDPTA